MPQLNRRLSECSIGIRACPFGRPLVMLMTVLWSASHTTVSAQIQVVPEEPTVPAVTTEIADITVPNDTADVIIDVSNHFEISNVRGQIVQFQLNAGLTVEGNTVDAINIELFDQSTTYNRPITTTNFLRYVNDGDYDLTFIHRSVVGAIIQGGGFHIDGVNTHIPTVDGHETQLELLDHDAFVQTRPLFGENSAYLGP